MIIYIYIENHLSGQPIRFQASQELGIHRRLILGALESWNACGR